jgi:hypothetical protein|nr:hypothetical protein [Faecalibaculum rodentium]
MTAHQAGGLFHDRGTQSLCHPGIDCALKDDKTAGAHPAAHQPGGFQQTVKVRIPVSVHRGRHGHDEAAGFFEPVRITGEFQQAAAGYGLAAGFQSPGTGVKSQHGNMPAEFQSHGEAHIAKTHHSQFTAA